MLRVGGAGPHLDLYPKNSGWPLRKGFNQRVTGPGSLTMASGWRRALISIGRCCRLLLWLRSEIIVES